MADTTKDEIRNAAGRMAGMATRPWLSRLPASLARRAVAAVLAVFAAVAVFSAGVSAQTAPYKFDIGAELGMSGYIGEANSANIFKHPGFTGELSGRYIPNSRFAFRAVFSTLSLKGNTSEMSDVLPGNAVYEFSSQVYELSVRAEFNFFAYGMGETYKRLRRWTPYLALGIGGGICSSGGKVYAAPTIPMAFGVKFKLRERINLFAEFSMTKSFSDHFDGPELSDLNQIKTAFYRNTDWYSRLTVGISYEFGKRCETCHYVE